jgi:uncharacterized protein YecT (DUF1311 family)
MKKILFSLILLLNTSLYANAIQCQTDGNQLQMNQCGYEEFQKKDKALNNVYKALKSKYKNDKKYLNNLKISQSLWIKFRDAELDLIFTCKDEDKRLCFGSIYPLLFNTKKAYITQQRTEILKSYVETEER